MLAQTSALSCHVSLRVLTSKPTVVRHGDMTQTGEDWNSDIEIGKGESENGDLRNGEPRPSGWTSNLEHPSTVHPHYRNCGRSMETTLKPISDGVQPTSIQGRKTAQADRGMRTAVVWLGRRAGVDKRGISVDCLPPRVLQSPLISSAQVTGGRTCRR